MRETLSLGFSTGQGLVLLVLAAFLAGLARGWWAKVASIGLAGVSLLWLLVNQPMEGQTLVELTRLHGLTEADLAGLAGLGLAVLRFMLSDWHPQRVEPATISPERSESPERAERSAGVDDPV